MYFMLTRSFVKSCSSPLRWCYGVSGELAHPFFRPLHIVLWRKWDVALVLQHIALQVQIYLGLNSRTLCYMKYLLGLCLVGVEDIILIGTERFAKFVVKA